MGFPEVSLRSLPTFLRPHVVRQFLKFALVGGVNTGVDLLVLNLLIYFFHTGETGWNYALFKSIAFTVAVINSYLLNKLWTFSGQSTKTTLNEIIPFLTVSLVGLVINVAVASSVATYVAAPFKGLVVWWPTVASLAGTALCLVWNFVGYKTLVFTHRELALRPEGEKVPPVIEPAP